MKYKIKKAIIYFLTIVLLSVFPFGPVQAEYRSDNYIIHENIHYEYSGPIISGVNSSVAGISATVNWTTNSLADSFVMYSTDIAFGSYLEVGTSLKTSTNHTVVIKGLSESTLYYFKVKSTRPNGGTTIESNIYSFTSGQIEDTPGIVFPAPIIQGGGTIIIDRTDQTPPEITNVVLGDITDTTIEMFWETDEPATSFIEYGSDDEFGSIYGQWEYNTEHAVILPRLRPGSVYYVRAFSSDESGNASRSDFRIIATSAAEGEPGQEIDESQIPEYQIIEIEPSEERVAEEATRRAIEFISRLFPEVSLNDFGPDEFSGVLDLGDFSRFIPSPILAGEPRVETGATEAIIRWSTDIAASSFVAFAPEELYRPGTNEPYIQISGDAENLTTSHEITLYGLQPETTYHFQIRSQGRLGPMARSRDFTFTTWTEGLKIESFFHQVIDGQTAVFRWITSREADSAIRFTPYRNNILAINEAKTIRNPAYSLIHEITIAEFVPGVFYEAAFISADREGNTVSETEPRFSTSEDDLPPVISFVKAESTIFLDKPDKTQTIISWKTNEPATSQVYYREGVRKTSAELANETPISANYVRDHIVVIPNLKPGKVYSFMAESIDSGGNVSQSSIYTFMTSKQRESIFQIILKILENTFGWLRKIF